MIKLLSSYQGLIRLVRPPPKKLHDGGWRPDLDERNKNKLKKFEDCRHFANVVALGEGDHDAGDEDVVHLQDPRAEQPHHADGIHLQNTTLAQILLGSHLFPVGRIPKWISRKALLSKGPWFVGDTGCLRNKRTWVWSHKFFLSTGNRWLKNWELANPKVFGARVEKKLVLQSKAITGLKVNRKAFLALFYSKWHTNHPASLGSVI